MRGKMKHKYIVKIPIRKIAMICFASSATVYLFEDYLIS